MNNNTIFVLNQRKIYNNYLNSVKVTKKYYAIIYSNLSSTYSPLCHYNNLNIVTRYVKGIVY